MFLSGNGVSPHLSHRKRHRMKSLSYGFRIACLVVTSILLIALYIRLHLHYSISGSAIPVMIANSLDTSAKPRDKFQPQWHSPIYSDVADIDTNSQTSTGDAMTSSMTYASLSDRGTIADTNAEVSTAGNDRPQEHLPNGNYMAGSSWMLEQPYPGPPYLNSNPRELRSDLVPSTVHYFWCKQGVFEFQNYLSVLSVVKVLQPMMIIFHYTHAPVDDNYYTWFKELQDHLPNFVLDSLGKDHICVNGSLRMNTVYETLVKHGGIFVGENTLVKRFTANDWAARSLKALVRRESWEGLLSVTKGKGNDTDGGDLVCCLKDQYEMSSDDCPCLIFTNSFYPKDILMSTNKSAELSRLVAYGTTKVLKPIQDFKNLAPRISHFIWFGNRTFGFSYMLSVLGSLYIAGMDRAYFHGDTKPSGIYWDYLEKEHNVSFIFMDLVNTVYNQHIRIPQHSADVAKAYVLLKYGGLTHDPDVYWVSRIPDRLLAYDTVLSYDWPKRDSWPESLNLGIVIAKANSKYLAAFLRTYRRNYFSYWWDYNPIRMPYRTYERYPETVHISHRLQVMCWGRTCHPTWVSGYIQPLENDAIGHPFDWRNDTLSVHITWPKPVPQYADFRTMKESSGMYSEIGRLICEVSGVDSSTFMATI